MQKEIRSRKDIIRDTQIYQTIYLKAGEIHHSRSTQMVHTVLGSCLSFVLYYPPLKLSTICHAQLAKKNNIAKICSDNCPVKCNTPVPDSCDFKYVTCSLEYMLNLFKKNHISKEKIIVKMFGGANVLPFSNNYKTIGDENIETALQLVKNHKLNLSAKSIGGTQGRVLYLYSESGDVYVSKLKNNKRD